MGAPKHIHNEPTNTMFSKKSKIPTGTEWKDRADIDSHAVRSRVPPHPSPLLSFLSVDRMLQSDLRFTNLSRKTRDFTLII